MALPLLVMVTAGLVWLLTVGFAQVRMVDAVRETARALARGDDRSAALAVGGRVAPEGVRFTISESAGLVTVRATGAAGGPGVLFGWVPDVRLTAEAVAVAEGDP
jgi:L-ascorbate metabolism protein UlaG (beta-lactamase superfamily)